MTDEEKKKEFDLKIQTQAQLEKYKATMFLDYADAFESDERLVTYVSNVIDDYEGHNLYEKLAVLRFFKHLDKYDFKTNKYKKFVKFYEAIKFTTATGARRFKLTPIQLFQVANIYGFYTEDGKRLIRNCLIFVPRKYAKTTFASVACCYDMLFGDVDSQAFVASNSFDQSKVCFSMIQDILLNMDPNEKHFRVNREMVRFQGGERRSFIKCLSASPNKKDGLNCSLAVIDEYSQAKSAELKQTLTSSMGARREPLVITITTASTLQDSPFIHELEGFKKVLRGELDNDRAFASIFQPDAMDENPESNPKVWRKCQPHWGVTVQQDYYEEAYKEALLSAENMAVFRTKLLNIFDTPFDENFINPRTLDKILIPIDIDNMKNRPSAMCAIDLSETDDFSAVTFGIYSTEHKTFKFHTTYFFPLGQLDLHVNRELYRDWADHGNLVITPGNVVDYSVIVNFILEANKKIQILKIGYDNWKSHDLINMLAASGAASVLQPISQTYGAFTAPTQAFIHGVETGKIYINDNPINKFCFNNAVLDYDSMQNCKPVKRGCKKGDKSHSNKNKIDGVITTLMCMRLFIDYER